MTDGQDGPSIGERIGRILGPEVVALILIILVVAIVGIALLNR